jgi:outer membrane protein TolC
VNLNLPLERKAERNVYRAALIAESRSQRELELRRDEIELQVRESWRTLEQARRTYEISEIGVKLAQRRVEEQELLADLGRAKALDQIDAQNSLLSSTDQRTQGLGGSHRSSPAILGKHGHPLHQGPGTMGRGFTFD